MSGDAPSAYGLPAGVYFQPWLGRVPGVSHEARIASMRTFAAQASRAPGVKGIAWHSGPRALDASIHLGAFRAAWDEYAEIANDVGLLALAGFGLDGTADTDGTALTAVEKGLCVADVATRGTCAAALTDLEGRWSSRTPGSPYMTPAAAVQLGLTLRERAPSAILIEQPFFDMRVHADFPELECARWVTLTAAQFYRADFPGRTYESLWSEYQASNAYIDAKRVAAGAARPRIETIQGYGWPETPYFERVSYLARAHDRPVIVYCEPYPDAATFRDIAIVQAMAELGFVGESAVAAFQSSAGLTADGKFGHVSLAALEQRIGRSLTP